MMTSSSLSAHRNELLTTKLEIPVVGSRILKRLRLVQQLHRGLDGRITLLVAPTGYGKTTLLGEWTASLCSDGWYSAWVSLDEYDNAAMRFWSYIAESLHKACPELCINYREMFRGQEGFEDFVALHPLLNEIGRVSRPICLVLDDYQSINAEDIHRSVNYFIEHQPANLHLVLSSRTAPPLNLARLGAQCAIHELTDADLTLDLPEVGSFFNETMGLELPDTVLKSILASTEGWITGVKLAALSYHGEHDIHHLYPAAGSGKRHIFNYMLEEVFNRQTLPVQDFLLDTSILSELCVPLCDAVTNGETARDCLSHIERENLFITSLDEQGLWYRYHMLFAGALLNHLQRTRPESIPGLHKRASTWLVENGYPEQAIVHALATKDIDFIGEILNSCAVDSLLRSDGLRMAQIFNHFTDEMVNHRPQLGIYVILFSLRFGRLSYIQQKIDMVEQALARADADHISDSQRKFIEWEIKAIKMLAEVRDIHIDRYITQYRQLMDSTPPEDTFFFGALCFAVASGYQMNGRLDDAIDYFRRGVRFATSRSLNAESIITFYKIGEILKMQGRLAEAVVEYENTLSFSNRHRVTNLLAQAGLLEIALERLDLYAAEHWKREIEADLYRIEKNPSSETEYETVLVNLAEYALLDEAYGKTHHYLDKAMRSMREHVYSTDIQMCRAVDVRARVMMQSGELAENPQRLLDDVEQLMDFGLALATRQNVQARLELAQGQVDPALERLQELEKLLCTWGAGERIIECLVLQAVAQRQAGRMDRAIALLVGALQLAAPAGYTAIFVREGDGVKDLLLRYQETANGTGQDTASPELMKYTAELLAAFDLLHAWRRGLYTASALQEGDTLAGQAALSAREMEVLALLVDGKSRKEMASILMVSINTIKSHTKCIYKKLGTHNRALLYRHAAELGLRLEIDENRVRQLL